MRLQLRMPQLVSDKYYMVYYYLYYFCYTLGLPAVSILNGPWKYGLFMKMEDIIEQREKHIEDSSKSLGSKETSDEIEDYENEEELDSLTDYSDFEIDDDEDEETQN